ncbi:hypothetical protein DN757_17420 [Paenibacillus silvae]|uniref:Uncharacterized protein n=1 Tax=Paenibacillus silvae TaxID=1325358 RepID=A0A2W6NEC5_9BACL|nr:hypothetical protein DN757_17420 [Paenibacillus silvae]
MNVPDPIRAIMLPVASEKTSRGYPCMQKCVVKSLMFDRVTGWMKKFIRRSLRAGKMVEVMLGSSFDG